jgi:hypothetical protein
MSQERAAVPSDAADHPIGTGIVAHDQMHYADDQVRKANQATNRTRLNLESSPLHQAVRSSNDIGFGLHAINQLSSHDIVSQNQSDSCVTKAADDSTKILDDAVNEENHTNQGKTPDNSPTDACR